VGRRKCGRAWTIRHTFFNTPPQLRRVVFTETHYPLRRPVSDEISLLDTVYECIMQDAFLGIELDELVVREACEVQHQFERELELILCGGGGGGRARGVEVVEQADGDMPF
jgi:hypothetical protein